MLMRAYNIKRRVHDNSITTAVGRQDFPTSVLIIYFYTTEALKCVCVCVCVCNIMSYMHVLDVITEVLLFQRSSQMPRTSPQM